MQVHRFSCSFRTPGTYDGLDTNQLTSAHCACILKLELVANVKINELSLYMNSILFYLRTLQCDRLLNYCTKVFRISILAKKKNNRTAVRVLCLTNILRVTSSYISFHNSSFLQSNILKKRQYVLLGALVVT